MGIDKETVLKNFSVDMDDSKDYLKDLRKQADEDGSNDDLEEGECKKLSLNGEHHKIDNIEYYFDEDENTLQYYGVMDSANGTSRIFFELPLSDVVLMDILRHAIKKLNKLKTAMETLK